MTEREPTPAEVLEIVHSGIAQQQHAAEADPAVRERRLQQGGIRSEEEAAAISEERQHLSAGF